jgi:D-alanine-D-alanine ligase
MAKNYSVGFSFNLDRNRTIEEAEFDTGKTILGVRNALLGGGHKVFCIEADRDVYKNLLKLKGKVDIIFNIAEGYSGSDSRESIFPIFFELLGIPYVGSSPETLALSLNKDASKKVFKYYNIPTPKFQVFREIDDLKEFNLDFPVIIKPVHEGTSKGIFNDSLVDNIEDLKKKVQFIWESYKEAAQVEQFIDGKEFSVGIIGNDPYTIFRPIEVDFGTFPPHLHHFYSYEAKTKYDDPNNLIYPAKITPHEEASVKSIALRAYKMFKCRDFGRCDFRMDRKGNLYVLEMTALPGISVNPIENHEFAKAGMAFGFTYTELINKILHCALKRYHMLD